MIKKIILFLSPKPLFTIHIYRYTQLPRRVCLILDISVPILRNNTPICNKKSLMQNRTTQQHECIKTVNRMTRIEERLNISYVPTCLYSSRKLASALSLEKVPNQPYNLAFASYINVFRSGDLPFKHLKPIT
jgi:hypothetical protein